MNYTRPSSRDTALKRSPTAMAAQMMLEQGSSKLAVDIACARKNSDVLEMVVEELGWTTTQGNGGAIVWVVGTDDIVERLRKLRSSEWLSHIPGMLDCCGKVALSEALQMRGASFWPRSWRAPETRADDICREAFKSGTGTVIIKPDTGSQGQGIHLARSSKELQRHLSRLQAPEAIVQEYVDRPLLLHGFKWDMRIYALVLPTSNGGLTAFLAHEGLVRVCVDPYELPDNRNLVRQTMHLTNYSLSKFSDKFVFSEDPSDASKGCKRSLSAVLNLLEAEGVLSARSTWQALASLTRQTVDALAGPLRAVVADPATWEGGQEVSALAQEHFQHTFHILGLDVLLDETGRPWLLEVNNNPSLSLDEIRPFPGSWSRAEINSLFASSRRSSSKWGRPCRCAGHPRPHEHQLCAVDCAVKLPVVRGTLNIIKRARASDQGKATSRAAWAQGTVFEPV
mmetsp:Transcript_86567/g.149814  ORF Transcript_86567/g.149814 Transcript_86567/m.149814 type:complete len:454 (-) Transcript_86567:164-1525(-)